MATVFRLNEVIVDTGILYALADEDDRWHRRSAEYVLSFKGKLIVPSTVIPEVCYLLNRNLGVKAELTFLEAIVNREFALENVTADDFQDCLKLMEQYRNVNIGVVDASLVVIAKRLKIVKILTTDRRHFSIVKPVEGRNFELLP